MKTALSIIEEVYDTALNPEEDYYAQLEPLAANGELANHNRSMRVILKMAMLMDKQEKRIAYLESKVLASKIITPDLTTPIDA